LYIVQFPAMTGLRIKKLLADSYWLLAISKK